MTIIKCHVQVEALFKIAGNHIRLTSANISETMQDGDGYYRLLIGSDMWSMNSANPSNLEHTPSHFNLLSKISLAYFSGL